MTAYKNGGYLLPVVQIMWVNRSWCFKFVPDFNISDFYAKKKVDSSVLIDKEIRNVKILT